MTRDRGRTAQKPRGLGEVDDGGPATAGAAPVHVEQDAGRRDDDGVRRRHEEEDAPADGAAGRIVRAEGGGTHGARLRQGAGGGAEQHEGGRGEAPSEVRHDRKIYTSGKRTSQSAHTKYQQMAHISSAAWRAARKTPRA